MDGLPLGSSGLIGLISYSKGPGLKEFRPGFGLNQLIFPVFHFFNPVETGSGWKNGGFKVPGVGVPTKLVG